MAQNEPIPIFILTMRLAAEANVKHNHQVQQAIKMHRVT